MRIYKLCVATDKDFRAERIGLLSCFINIYFNVLVFMVFFPHILFADFVRVEFVGDNLRAYHHRLV